MDARHGNLAPIEVDRETGRMVARHARRPRRESVHRIQREMDDGSIPFPRVGEKRIGKARRRALVCVCARALVCVCARALILSYPSIS